jgi:hypothetical protein
MSAPQAASLPIDDLAEGATYSWDGQMGGTMIKSTLAACTLVTTAALLAPAASASAASSTTGNERFDGFLVAIASNGARHIAKSQITARGVFTGFGRIVEVPNRPGDSDNSSRDDLVFPRGTMHLKSVNKSFHVQINPHTCALTVDIQQTGTVLGGTGRFARAVGHFKGSVSGWGVADRNKSGACSTNKALVLEIDVVSATGTLTF